MIIIIFIIYYYLLASFKSSVFSRLKSKSSFKLVSQFLLYVGLFKENTNPKKILLFEVSGELKVYHLFSSRLAATPEESDDGSEMISLDLVLHSAVLTFHKTGPCVFTYIAILGFSKSILFAFNCMSIFS